MFFGRPHGAVHLILAVVGVGVLGLLSFVVFNLNNRLDNQEKANQDTLIASHAIVDVNDKVTLRLAQLTDLTGTARQAVDETQALGPLLGQLREAVAPAAAMVASGASGAQTSNAQLTTIQGVLNAVRDKVVPLVSSAAAFGEQGKQLVGIVQGLVSDLQGAVDAAKTINKSLPLPG